MKKIMGLALNNMNKNMLSELNNATLKLQLRKQEQTKSNKKDKQRNGYKRILRRIFEIKNGSDFCFEVSKILHQITVN